MNNKDKPIKDVAAHARYQAHHFSQGITYFINHLDNSQGDLEIEIVSHINRLMLDFKECNSALDMYLCRAAQSIEEQYRSEPYPD